MRRREEDQRVAEVYRDSFHALMRRVVFIALAVGSPTIAVLIAVRADTDVVVRWGYPPLLGYLLVYAWILLRRPQHAVPFSRVTLGIFEAAFLVAMVVLVRTAPDAASGWSALFPTTFMSMHIFIVVGYLFHGTRGAMVNAAAVVLGVLAVGTGALMSVPGGSAYVLDLVRYSVSLAVAALLLQVLSQAKIRLATALATAQRATDEASQMRDMAYLDPLTGLGNRRRLLEELRYQAARVSVAEPVSVVYFDLDHFKEVNDRHGHAVGDQVLTVVARAALLTVRSQDVVARVGGEEFVVVTPGSGEDQAVQLAERLRAKVPEEVQREVGVPITASFGVVPLRSGEDPLDVLARVDEQMYVAKRSGRDTVARLG